MTDLPEMVTVLCGPNGLRISRVTPHGEEVIVPDVLAAAMGVMLWARVTEKDLVGWNVFDLSPEAAKIILRQALGKPLEVLDSRQTALDRDHQSTLARIHDLETQVSLLRETASRLPTNLLLPTRPQ